MSIQAISAQSLKPVVSFKAEQDKKPEQGEKQKSSVGKKVAWTLGGAAALAGLVFAGIKMAKGKGASLPKDVSVIKQEIAQHVKAGAGETAANLAKPLQEAKNIRLKNDAEAIVQKFEKMDKKAKAHGLIQTQYDKVNWDATPISRAEALAK